MIDQTIAHYKILEKLGEGGMGVVYKAHDTKLDRVVALKFLPHHLTASEAEQARFLQEAKASAALNHPNVCSVIDIQEVDGNQFIVMEYVDGKTLRHIIQSAIPAFADASAGGPNPQSAISYAIQIGEALHEAHSKGIVHRDIKCENIMVNSRNQVKVMDFGLAKLKGSLKLTKASSTVGTLAYMAPEQIQGGEVDGRSDIFSFGVVLFEMLTGKMPFRGEHDAAMMYSILNEEPESVLKFKPDVSPDLDRIIHRSLEKDPEDRYQSVADMVSELRRLQKSSSRVVRPQQLDVPKIDRDTQEPTTVTKRPTFWRWAAIGMGAVAVVVAVWFTFLHKPQQTITSMAVLPFENAGNDPSMEYLSDGIAESIINSLTRIPELRVVPRSTAFRLKGTDPQEAGTKLKVHAVLAGRITQRGDGLTVQVDLVDVENQSQLWGQQYRSTTKDLLSLQDEITTEVSNRLRLGISGETKEKVTKRYTDNPEAYKLYLQGRYFWNKRRASEIQRAIESFDQALALDPSYALAYVGLADSYVLLEQYAGMRGKEVYPKAVAAATRALEIDNSLAEAHTTLAFANCALWNWEKSEQEFKYSISLNPNYPTTYHWYSILLHALGRHDEAFTTIKQAQTLDPLSPVIAINVALAYSMQGNNERALQDMDAVLDIDSSFSPAYVRKAQCYAKMGRMTEGYAAALKGVETSGRSAESLSFLGYCAALLGKRDEAASIVKELEQRFSSSTSPGYYIARVYLGLGESDRMYKWLNADFENHAGAMIWLPQDREWDQYRTDPRFVNLLKKIGLGK